MSLLTLNELANAYARGKLDKENYRQSRSALLKGIVEGKVAVETGEYLSPLAVAEDAVTKPQEDWDTTQIASPGDNASSKPKSAASGNISAEDMAKPVKNDSSAFPVRYIAISSAIVLFLIIAIVLFYPKPPSSTSTNNQTASSATSNILVSSEKSKAGENLIASFLQNNSWDEDSLNTFLNDWNNLAPQEKLAATQTKRMQRLSSTIYKKFLEEKALIGINEDKAIKRQQQLIDFAQALGIYDSRMKIQ